MKITIDWLADTINEHCQKFEYFWAVGLVKETIDMWKVKDNYNLLDSAPQAIADHYLKEV